MKLLYRFTVKSAERPPAFGPSSLVLPFDGRLEADEFACELLKKYALYGPFDVPCPIEVYVNPVAFRTERAAAGAQTSTQ